MQGIKNLLLKNCIELQNGLSRKEIDTIESLYGFSFPTPLKDFYMEVLPVGNGFYNWRDFDANNIFAIQYMMKLPRKNFMENLEWYEEIQSDMGDIANRKRLVGGIIDAAPLLIPIRAHRYIPICSLKEYPVISVHGLDVIYYGRNLYEYLEIEFGLKRHKDIDFSSIEYIPFWSDVM